MYLHISTLPHQSLPLPLPHQSLPPQKQNFQKSTLHLLNPLQIIRILNRSIQFSRRGLLEQFPRLESNILRSRDLRFFGNFSFDHEGRAVDAFGAVFFVQAVQEIVLRCFAGGEGELGGFLVGFWLVFLGGFAFFGFLCVERGKGITYECGKGILVESSTGHEECGCVVFFFAGGDELGHGPLGDH